MLSAAFLTHSFNAGSSFEVIKKELAEAPRSNASSSRSRGISSRIPQVVVETKEAQERSIHEIGSSSTKSTTRKQLNIWQHTGLDVTDSTFAKALASGQSKFSESTFDLSSLKVAHF